MQKLILFIILFLCITSCDKSEDAQPQIEKVVITYMAGNNSLRQDIENAIIRMEEGYTKKENQKLLVYVKTDRHKSHLIDINSKGIGKSDTLKTYYDMNSSSPNTLKKVINEVKKLHKAKTYSLVMSSHGTSWFPESDIKFRSFGQDEGKELSIKDLRIALSDIKLDFILFDACYMSSIEVLYELKNSAKYIIASPSEVISFGFPYEKVANLFFENEEGLIKICKEYISFYDKQHGRFQSANVAMIKTEALNQVIDDLKRILIKNFNKDLRIDNVQQLVFDDNVDYEAYDLLSFIKTNFNTDEVKSFKKKLDESLSYIGNTPSFNGKTVNDFCGISIYYPQKNRTNLLYNSYYTTYSFYRDSGIKILYGKLIGL